ncbi:MAG: SDR family oxidoreductase [Clostridia bacterium]|nr:SDR family oxidoreductase [Clostridia bacterium]
MKKVIVTGGNGGIGSACVRDFCRLGDAVSFSYCTRKAEAMALEKETYARAYQTDFATPGVAASFVRRAADDLSGLDVLVCCSGRSLIRPYAEMTPGDWAEQLQINLTSHHEAVLAALPYFLKAGGGSVVLVGSMWGKTGASCEAAYSAAKAGLRGLTYALAKELGPSSIRVNCVEPGLIDTRMNRELDAKTIEDLVGQTPLGRMGTPADVAGAIAFLCSDRASFITGQCLGVDGGFAI